MTNTTNLANQLAYACQVDPAAAGPALRYAFRLAILNSTPHEIKLLASQLPQNPPEGADSPGWAPDALAASLRLYADDLNRSPLALGGK